MSYGWSPYVPVWQRVAKAEREVAKLKKQGHAVAPIRVDGRKITRTFWGEAWCENLERYSDYANRLPRGRNYVRNGLIVDLQIGEGEVTALVSGSSIYRVSVTVSQVGKKHWEAICRDCSGSVASLVELLGGRLSAAVMARICEPRTGLFPSPAEIRMKCSCPDWATMCKHVAAVLYGIGARLDERPELLFKLRSVDAQELIAQAGAGAAQLGAGASGENRLDESDLEDLFGLELAIESPAPARSGAKPGKARVKTIREPRVGKVRAPQVEMAQEPRVEKVRGPQVEKARAPRARKAAPKADARATAIARIREAAEAEAAEIVRRNAEARASATSLPRTQVKILVQRAGRRRGGLRRQT